MKKVLLTLMLSLGLVGGAYAQESASDTLTVDAEILAGLEIDCSTLGNGIDMGKFVGSYGLTSAADTDGLARAGNSANEGSKGLCLINGAPDAQYVIYVTDDAGTNAADVATVTHADTSTMEVSLFEDGGTALDSQVRTLDPTGAESITIDGSIAAGTYGANTSGPYSGSATVEVSY